MSSNLVKFSKNQEIIKDLSRFLQTWDYKSVETVEEFKEDIPQVVKELVEAVFSGKDVSAEVPDLITEVVHSEVYDTLFYRIKQQHHKEDLRVYQMSIEFCKTGGTPKQLGHTIYNFIPSASVVELSMLNNKNTPKDKLDCLQTTYDYIFAEVKSALISVISKYSEKEIDLPLINNKEVIPIVMAVILKSKMFYFVSDMAYIELFADDILEKNVDLKFILMVFKESLKNILKMSDLTVHCDNLSSDKLENKLSVCDTISFIEKLDKKQEGDPSILQEERLRVAKLITVATTQGLEEND
ncbi:receptor-mediated endocytosis protein 6-like isoform X2 [Anthonomus grandis grandis]|uniref:receptor-mediated endocytosis protein 6-like isoform X2 n=1 Tax=Anthonomus grandis grandis TaxID=2921223 RepID=UPI002165CB6C|nr:receptor-mediated endocytosis protein 6-like isoform X2 [Anthonomus grandis grandis]